MIATVKTDDFTMDYCRFGNGDRVFVMIPGLSTEKLSPREPAIAAQYSLLTNDFTVYLFDRRNELPENYGTEEMAEDTALVMRRLGLKNVCLYGSSQGGMIAQAIAAGNPDLVERLVLASTSSRPNETTSSVIGSWVETAEKGNGEELNAGMIEKVYSKRFREEYAELIRAAIAPMSGESLKRFITLARPIITFDFYDRLSEIKCPVFVIGCDGDRVLTGQASREIAEKLGCRLHMYGDEYGHAAYDEASDCVALIYGFISGN